MRVQRLDRYLKYGYIFKKQYSTNKFAGLKAIMEDAETVISPKAQKTVNLQKKKPIKEVDATDIMKEINKYMQIPIKYKATRGEYTSFEKFFKLKTTKISLDWSLYDNKLIKEGDIPEVLLLGRCNVGKSSLINALLHQDIARVKQHAGYTPCLNFYNVGQKFRLVDSPGYGIKGKRWQGQLVTNYVKERRILQKVYVIVDASIGITIHDESIMDMLRDLGIVFDLIFHKVDKIPNSKRLEAVTELVTTGYIGDMVMKPQCYAVSSKTKSGVAELFLSMCDLSKVHKTVVPLEE